jgi:hypothetical protein
VKPVLQRTVREVGLHPFYLLLFSLEATYGSRSNPEQAPVVE